MPEHTAWITAQIRKICETYKNRTAGSESVRSAMRYMAGQLQSWSDSVKESAFSFAFTQHGDGFLHEKPLC